MKTKTTGHPTEEMLIEFALEGNNAECEQHIAQCTTCARFVEDIQEIGHTFSTIRDEEPSPALRKRVLSISEKKGLHNWMGEWIQAWHRYPFVIGILTAFFAIFLYILYLYLV
jgi:hypothetical protein